MAWEGEYTDEFEAQWETLGGKEQQRVRRAIEKLEEAGPALARPLADSVRGSRHANMKELRPSGTNIRVLFAFDPRRVAFLLIGGDKTGRWVQWYEQMIPVADALYDVYLDELKREGLL